MSRLAVAIAAAGRSPDAEALDALAQALAPRLRRLLDREHDGAELVDVVRTVPAPKRAVMRACRTGRIAGASLVSRRWVAPRASVDAWLRTLGPRLVVEKSDEGDELDAMRASLARPATRRRRKRAA